MRAVWWGSSWMLFPWYHVKSLFPELSFLAFRCASLIPDGILSGTSRDTCEVGPPSWHKNWKIPRVSFISCPRDHRLTSAVPDQWARSGNGFPEPGRRSNIGWKPGIVKEINCGAGLLGTFHPSDMWADCWRKVTERSKRNKLGRLHHNAELSFSFIILTGTSCLVGRVAHSV